MTCAISLDRIRHISGTILAPARHRPQSIRRANLPIIPTDTSPRLAAHRLSATDSPNTGNATGQAAAAGTDGSGARGTRRSSAMSPERTGPGTIGTRTEPPAGDERSIAASGSRQADRAGRISPRSSLAITQAIALISPTIWAKSLRSLGNAFATRHIMRSSAATGARAMHQDHARGGCGPTAPRQACEPRPAGIGAPPPGHVRSRGPTPTFLAPRALTERISE